MSITQAFGSGRYIGETLDTNCHHNSGRYIKVELDTNCHHEALVQLKWAGTLVQAIKNWHVLGKSASKHENYPSSSYAWVPRSLTEGSDGTGPLTEGSDGIRSLKEGVALAKEQHLLQAYDQGHIDPQSGERACTSAYACRDGEVVVVTTVDPPLSRPLPIKSWKCQPG